MTSAESVATSVQISDHLLGVAAAAGCGLLLLLLLVDYSTFSVKRVQKMTLEKMAARPELKLFISVVGIYTCYLTYGVLQEWIYSYRTPEGDRFSSTLFLLFIQVVANTVIAAVGILTSSSPDDLKHSKMPVKSVAMMGLCYISAMMCSNEALKYVSYPTQALAKSCKMIPVMIARLITGDARFSITETLTVLLITAGITVFRMAGKELSNEGNSVYGLLLLFGSLALDGATGVGQDRLNKQHRPSAFQLMFHLNFWVVLMLAVAVLVTGQGIEGWIFCVKNPQAALYIAMFSVSSGIGQIFIFYALKNFNSLVLATITTTRKFFTILASVFMFGHALLPTQWVGVLLVFVGLMLELYQKYQKTEQPKSPQLKE